MLIKEELLSTESVEVKNKLYKPVLILIITLMLLIIISFIPADTEVAGVMIRSVDLISDIKPD